MSVFRKKKAAIDPPSRLVFKTTPLVGNLSDITIVNKDVVFTTDFLHVFQPCGSGNMYITSNGGNGWSHSISFFVDNIMVYKHLYSDTFGSNAFWEGYKHLCVTIPVPKGRHRLRVKIDSNSGVFTGAGATVAGICI